jgi:hypothetical protein
MAYRIQNRRTEALDWLADLAVWSAVLYLDSSTDYREYLPPSGRPFCLPESEFVTLDNGRFDWNKLRVTTLAAVFVCMILLLSMRS